MLRLTDDTGILQHAIFSVPNCSEGYTTDDNARALIVSTLLDEGPIRVASAAFQIPPIAISPSSGSPFTPILAGSETFSVMNANGLKMSARMTAMAVPLALECAGALAERWAARSRWPPL